MSGYQALKQRTRVVFKGYPHLKMLAAWKMCSLLRFFALKLCRNTRGNEMFIQSGMKSYEQLLQYGSSTSIVHYNIASRAAQSNSVYVSMLQIPIVDADSVSKSLRQKSRRI